MDKGSLPTSAIVFVYSGMTARCQAKYSYNRIKAFQVTTYGVSN
jgi:hypothetical protein